MDSPAYLLLDEDATPIGLEQTLEEALAVANEIDLSGQIYLDAPTEQDYALIAAAESEEAQLAANVSTRATMRKVRSGPADALAAIKAAVSNPETAFDYAAAVGMPIEEAHRRLLRFFPKNRYAKKTGKRVPVKGYQRARGTLSKKGMAYYILGQNSKTSKKTPHGIIAALEEATGFRKANVLGLSLLPSTQSYAQPMVQQILRTASKRYGTPEVQPVHLNACARATAECASSCLVFSGCNVSDDYNTVKKYALVESLIHEPQAFMRMLTENIRLHRDKSFRAATMPLVRLNVFSDLPWELMFPELFDEFHDVQFYDYTKVANRKPPSNYDLTFSFAGTAQNVAAMDYEIGKFGRRVAVVFAATKLRVLPGLGKVEIPKPPKFYRRKTGAESKSPQYARLPETFLGLPVIDGDMSDMRPYDPAPSIVGLRWKIPANQNVTLEQAKVFVVLVDLVTRAGGYVDAVVSKTARFDDVDYAEYAPSNVDE